MKSNLHFSQNENVGGIKSGKYDTAYKQERSQINS